jgi:hypothetical protein
MAMLLIIPHNSGYATSSVCVTRLSNWFGIGEKVSNEEISEESPARR